MKHFCFQNNDTIPALGLGTWLSGSNEVYDAVLEAIRLGYRHIDCASIYKNEAEIGKAIRFAIANGMVRRDELFITSKLWNSDHHPESVQPAIERSLESLQLDYLDLYLVHWPMAFKKGQEQAHTADDLVTPQELPPALTWKAMEHLKHDGLARHIGVSNFNIPKLQLLIEQAEIKPELNQIELHPYFSQQKLVDFCFENKILVTAYSPLGSRHLVHSDKSLATHPGVKQIAEKHGCMPTQVVLAWGIQRNTSVIPKSVNATRIRDNYESIFVVLDHNDMQILDSLNCDDRQAKGLYAVLPGGCYTYNNIWNE